MRKLFFLLTLLVMGVFALDMAAQQQGSGQSPTTPVQGSSDQTPAATQSPNDVPSPDSQATDSPGTPQDKTADKQDADKPTRGERVKKHMKDQMSSWCVGAPLNHCYERKPSDDAKGGDAQAQAPRAPRSDDTATAPPIAPGESSSNDTKVNLSAPVGDAADHPDSSLDTGTSEFHPWDPHRAMKNIEVGDYYYKQKNYRAAVSRYEEALQWKPRDAEATYKLAEAQEKLGDKLAARKNYQAYLSILPEGPRAQEANKALARLK
jgi:tetratricopeptide (TPR) repeat protein